MNISLKANQSVHFQGVPTFSVSLATRKYTVYVVNKILVRKYLEKNYFVKGIMMHMGEKAAFRLTRRCRDGSEIVDVFCKKRSKEMLANNIDSHTPQTLPSIFL